MIEPILTSGAEAVNPYFTRQHAQPGGWWHVLLHEMQELPHGQPVVQILQHRRAGGLVGLGGGLPPGFGPLDCAGVKVAVGKSVNTTVGVEVQVSVAVGAMGVSTGTREVLAAT